MITVWGLKNCDSCKKARKWLEARGTDYVFKDVRADGLDAGTIGSWLESVEADVLLNKRGTTWRGLDEANQKRAETQEGLVELLAELPALIKRPVFVLGESARVGFSKVDQQALEELL